MINEPRGFRRYNDLLTLTKATIEVDEYGHREVNGEQEVMKVYALVRQMSATKTMLTFQQADVVGLEIEFRAVNTPFDGITWRGHRLTFSHPEDVGNKGRIVRMTAYYQEDNPGA